MPKVVKLLERLKNRDVPADYTYYGIASPWLQVRVSKAAGAAFSKMYYCPRPCSVHVSVASICFYTNACLPDTATMLLHCPGSALSVQRKGRWQHLQPTPVPG